MSKINQANFPRKEAKPLMPSQLDFDVELIFSPFKINNYLMIMNVKQHLNLILLIQILINDSMVKNVQLRVLIC